MSSFLRRIVSVVLAIATCGLLLAPRPYPAQAAAPNTFFRPVLPVLHRTGVPVLLPHITVDRAYPLYAQIALARQGHYILYIGYTPTCSDAHACEYGWLEGRRRTARMRRHPAGSPVALRGGLTGYFVGFTCGANCDDSILAFDRGPYRYTFGVKATARADMIRLANSALAAGPA